MGPPPAERPRGHVRTQRIRRATVHSLYIRVCASLSLFPHPLREQMSSTTETRHAGGDLSGVQLSDDQREAVGLVLGGHNVLLTGSGGAGKSFLLRYLIDALRAQGLVVQVSGSTGMAAVNVGGTTLHRLLGCGLASEPLPALQAALMSRRKVVARWRAMNVLIVDEVSMLGAEFLHKCDQLARWMRGREDFLRT